MNYNENIISTQLSLLENFNNNQDSKLSFIQKKGFNKSNGKTIKYRTNCCTLYITVNYIGKKIHEVLVHTGKRGGGCKANIEAITKIVNLCLQNDIPVSKIMTKLRDIRCPAVSISMAKGRKFDALSCPDAIFRALHEVWTTED